MFLPEAQARRPPPGRPFPTREPPQAFSDGIQPFLRGLADPDNIMLSALLIGWKGYLPTVRRMPYCGASGIKARLSYTLLQLGMLRDIPPAACENAALLKPGFSSEHLKVKILKDGIGTFQGRG